MTRPLNEPREGDANENEDEVEEVFTGENVDIVTPSPNQALETVDSNNAAASASCEAFIGSQNMLVLDDGDDDDDGIGEGIADEVVFKMLKGAPNTLDTLECDEHTQHGQCQKIHPEHVNNLTLAMYNEQ